MTPIDCMDNIIKYLHYYKHRALLNSKTFGDLEPWYDFKRAYTNLFGPGEEAKKRGLTREAVCNQCKIFFPRRPISDLVYCDMCYDFKPSPELLKIKKPGQMHGNLGPYGYQNY